MNFVAQVEEHLRDLGTEARKNHPGTSTLCFMEHWWKLELRVVPILFLI
jgi:hypothetical protein